MSNSPKKSRIAFRPSLSGAVLEDRVVLTSGATITIGNGLTSYVVPATGTGVSNTLTPVPASPPFSLPGHGTGSLTAPQLRSMFAQQSRAATTDLRNMVTAGVRQLYANGATPTAQQLTDFSNMVGGAVNATALRLSTQASLLPNSSTKLVSNIQNSLLGSGSNSLLSRVNALTQNGRLTNSAASLQSALTRQINLSGQQNSAQLSNFFNTTSLNKLSVDSTGQRIPLQQFLGGQLVNQLGNTLGSFGSSLGSVANSTLFPDGTTAADGTSILPGSGAQSQFGAQLRNALSTAAFQLGSGLSVIPGSSNLVAQLQPMLFGSGNSTGSLASSLLGLPFGSTGFDSAASTALNTTFSNLTSPINSFLGLTGSSSAALPTGNFTSPFGSSFTSNNFSDGFNNGFATTGNTGFLGFGTAPSTFNDNFGSGFNNYASSVNSNIGFTQPDLGLSFTGFGTGSSTGAGQIGTGNGTGVNTGTTTTTGTGA